MVGGQDDPWQMRAASLVYEGQDKLGKGVLRQVLGYQK